MTANLVIQFVARLALAAIFIWSGAGKLADLGGTAGAIGSVGLPLPALLAPVTALVEIVGGVALALGFLTRYAAVALLLLTALATLLFHGFWAFEGAARHGQLIHFMKNLAIIGGLLLAAATPQERLFGRMAGAPGQQAARQEA
jgi:putative oxidoreductase